MAEHACESKVPLIQAINESLGRTGNVTKTADELGCTKNWLNYWVRTRGYKVIYSARLEPIQAAPVEALLGT